MKYRAVTGGGRTDAESPNLTRFCRLASSRIMISPRSRSPDHDAPKIRKARASAMASAASHPLRRQGFLQQGLTDIRQALLERFAGGENSQAVLLGNDVPRYGGSKERLLVAEPRIDRGLA